VSGLGMPGAIAYYAFAGLDLQLGMGGDTLDAAGIASRRACRPWGLGHDQRRDDRRHVCGDSQPDRGFADSGRRQRRRHGHAACEADTPSGQSGTLTATTSRIRHVRGD